MVYSVDAALVIQMRAAESFKCGKQRIPIRCRRRGERILSVVEARGIPPVGVNENAQQQPCEQAEHGKTQIISRLRLDARGEKSLDLGVGGVKHGVKLCRGGDVLQKPARGLFVMQRRKLCLHRLEKRRVTFIQAVAQSCVVAENAHGNDLRRQPLPVRRSGRSEPAPVGKNCACGRVIVRGDGRVIAGEQVGAKCLRGFAHVVQQPDEPCGRLQPELPGALRAKCTYIAAVRAQRLRLLIRFANVCDHGIHLPDEKCNYKTMIPFCSVRRKRYFRETAYEALVISRLRVQGGGKWRVCTLARHGLHRLPEFAENRVAETQNRAKEFSEYEGNRNRAPDRRPRPRGHPQGDPPHHAHPRGRPVTDNIGTVGAVLRSDG